MPFLFASQYTCLTDILLNISHTWRFDCLCSSLESFVDNLVSYPTKWSLSFILRPQQGSYILASCNWEIYRIYVLVSGDTDERLPWPILFTFTAQRKPDLYAISRETWNSWRRKNMSGGSPPLREARARLSQYYGLDSDQGAAGAGE